MVIALQTFVQMTSHRAPRCRLILPFNRVEDIGVLTLNAPDVRLSFLGVRFCVLETQVDDDLLA